jgi:glycosyltransferase involved in cell wall biosynthesis
MRIGQVVHSYLPRIGGVANYIYRLKSLLKSQGHKVTIYTTDLSLIDGGTKDEDAIYCKTNVSLLRNPFSLELARRLASSSEDIYHLHAPWFFASLIAARVLKGRPKVMTVHSARIESKNLMIGALNMLYHPFAQYVLSNMDMLVPLGEREREQLVARFKLREDRIVPIPNGIEVADFQRNNKAEAEFAYKYNLRRDSFKILYVSRLVPEKNPDKLIQAVSKYMKEDNIEVIIIGGGAAQYISHLKAVSNHRIHILGKVPQEELLSAYYSSNLFVFLGLWEGMPTVILEAMACGLPVLTTPVAGIPDMVTEGENGSFISIPIDERELANKIAHFMKEIDTVKMGKANMLKVSQNYTWDIIGSKISDVYGQVLDRRRNER